MRIVAGELGGRRLVTPDRRRTEVRPTSDRVREALFSILGDPSGLRVLDLFCGTGALGIEAISRGAATVTLVDSSIELAERNVGALEIGERCRVVRSDAVRFLANCNERFDLVLCDPPYKLARRLGPDLDRHLPDLLTDGSRVVVESSLEHPLELRLPVRDERRYGTTMIRIHGVER